MQLPGGATQSYRYDPLGRRIEVAGSTTKRFAYGADQNMQAEFAGSGTQTASYVFGQGFDSPLKMNRAGASSYYQQDALGSVKSLSSGSGLASQRYSYGSFGQPLTGSDTSGNPFTFTGRELDGATGDYHYRARSYDAGVGRFTGEDPVPSVNGYGAFDQNPVSLVDPTGLFSLSETEATEEVEGDLQKINTGNQREVMKAVRQMGREGEERGLKCLEQGGFQGVLKNTKTVIVDNRARIPDVLDRPRGILAEIKNVGRLSFTRQIRDYLTIAEMDGLDFRLLVRSEGGTAVSGPLQEVIDAGRITKIECV